MDILTQLMADHRRFHQMIASLDTQAFDSAGKYYTREWTHEVGRPLLAIMRRLVPDIARHEEIEHRLLFVELLKHGADLVELLEAMDEEHEAIRHILSEFLAAVSTPYEVPTRGAILRFLSLMNLLQQHMMREEIEIFEAARRRIPAEVLERLGQEAAGLAAAA